MADPCAALLCCLGISIMAGVMCDKQRLSYGFFENLRGPMSVRRKLRLLAANSFRKIRQLRGCCGDYGQPGC